MKSNFRLLLSIAIVILCGLFGWWLARELRPPVKIQSVKEPVVTAHVDRQETPVRKRTVRVIEKPDEFRDGTTVEMFASSKPNQVILRFPSDETYAAFLAVVVRSKVAVIDQLDRLRAMRLGYEDRNDLADLLIGENISIYDSLPVAPGPTPPPLADQEGLVPFHDQLLPWLGVVWDHSRWGEGVKIAVIDSGIVAHSNLAPVIQSIELVPFPKDLSTTNGHGTAVASLIAGLGEIARGVAPAASLISIRVGDETDAGDSFSLAAGIVAAVDAGADLINISMGISGNNPLVEDAVLYADESGSLIVAASGNAGLAEASYPAAYPSVISVGAVDAKSEHLEFSNYGEYLSMTAPGYAINAAWPGNRFIRISGTSASAPIVTGAIAATMSNGAGITLSAREAAEIVMAHSNDAGIPGPDSEYGIGIVDLGRVMNRNQTGLVDAAITDQRVVKTATGHEVQVTVQNRGTAILINTFLEITTPSGTRQHNATTIAPGEIQTFAAPVQLAGLPKNTMIPVTSRVILGTADVDRTPANNQKTSEFLSR
jgi:hypothetical protein